ncbi:MAG: hypothetical protein ACRETI_04695, partial [Steroidobacteraceae bacterium]
MGALIVATALVVLALLIEAAMPAMRTRRAAPASRREPWISNLRRRMGNEPRRARLAAAWLRATVLATLL